MAQARGDTDTLDLLTDWTPPEIVKRFDDRAVRSASLRDTVALAVAEALRSVDTPREEIAEAMSDWLGEDVTKNMLDAYASPARAEHTISYLRLLALVHVTGDVRALQIGAELFGHLVVEERYVEWVRVGMRADRKEQALKVAEDADREFLASLKLARRRP